MNKENRSIQRIRIDYLVTTIFIVALSFLTFSQLNNLFASIGWVNHTNLVTLALEKSESAVLDAETNQRGFLLTSDSLLLNRRDAAYQNLANEINLTDSLVQDNPYQVASLKLLHTAIEAKITSMKKVLDLFKNSASTPEFRQSIVEGTIFMDSVKARIGRMTETEKILLAERNKKYAFLTYITPILVIILFLGAILILLLSYLRINSGLKESRQLQDRLLEEKVLAQTIINSSPDNIIVLDNQLRYMIANTKAEQILKTISPDYIGKSISAFFPNSGAYDDMHRTLKGETIHRDHFYSAATGLYFEAIYTPLRKGTEITGIIAVSRDITGVLRTNKLLEQQKEELEERNNFVEMLLNASIDAIIVVDREMKFISVNKKAEEGFARLYPNNVIGKKVSEVIPDGSTVEVEAALRGENIMNNNFKSSRSGRYFEINYVPLRKRSEVYAVMVVTHDITERVQAEENLLTINQSYQYAEQVGLFGSYKYNFSTKQLFYSDNLYRILGCEPQEFPPSAENFLKFVHPDDLQYVLNATGAAFSDRKVSKWEYRIIRKDSQITYVRGTGKLVGDSVDSQWLIGTLQDITEEKKLEGDLSRKNTDLEKMNKELQSFAYISSHDLQEPLRKILLFTSRILEKDVDLLSDSSKDYFSRIQRASRKMQALIEDLIRYSRSSESERKFEECDLAILVNEVVGDMREELDSRKATIEVGHMCAGYVIKFQFRQLLQNLISNSLKFSKEQLPPQIKIHSEVLKGEEVNYEDLPPSSKYCHISVADNGIGFDSRYKERIFEVFQRLNPGHKQAGTGIGLAIVKKIVENHHGVIEVTSVVDQGTKMDIYIPAG